MRPGINLVTFCSFHYALCNLLLIAVTLCTLFYVFISNCSHKINSSDVRSTKRRPKRQVRNYSKYEELAEKTGGNVVQVERGRVEEVTRMLEVEQYPAVRDKSVLSKYVHQVLLFF